MNNFFAALSTWWKAPFSNNVGAVHVFLGVGLVLVSLMLWLIVLGHLRNVKLTG